MKRFINIAVLCICFIFMSCSTADNNIKYVGDCERETKILKIYGDTIRIEYNFSEKTEALRTAEKYCKDRNKIAHENQLNCDGCCRVTFLCKSQ